MDLALLKWLMLLMMKWTKNLKAVVTEFANAIAQRGKRDEKTMFDVVDRAREALEMMKRYVREYYNNLLLIRKR